MLNDCCLRFECVFHRDGMCEGLDRCIFQNEENKLNSTLGITYTAEEQEINERLNQFS